LTLCTLPSIHKDSRMKRYLSVIIGLLACTLTWAEIKVVYHLSEGIPQASRAIGNIYPVCFF